MVVLWVSFKLIQSQEIRQAHNCASKPPRAGNLIGRTATPACTERSAFSLAVFISFSHGCFDSALRFERFSRVGCFRRRETPSARSALCKRFLSFFFLYLVARYTLAWRVTVVCLLHRGICISSTYAHRCDIWLAAWCFCTCTIECPFRSQRSRGFARFFFFLKEVLGNARFSRACVFEPVARSTAYIRMRSQGVERLVHTKRPGRGALRGVEDLSPS